MPFPRQWVATAFAFEGNDVAPDVAEVLTYGTAVVIEPPPPR